MDGKSRSKEEMENDVVVHAEPSKSPNVGWWKEPRAVKGRAWLQSHSCNMTRRSTRREPLLPSASRIGSCTSIEKELPSIPKSRTSFLQREGYVKSDECNSCGLEPMASTKQRRKWSAMKWLAQCGSSSSNVASLDALRCKREDQKSTHPAHVYEDDAKRLLELG